MAAFQPKNVNWQMDFNQHAHHTDKFFCQDLVLRRGQAFQISVTIDQKPGDGLVFTAATGPSPSEAAKTMAVFSVSKESSSSSWSAQLVSNQNNTQTFSITSSASAPIGWYTLSLRPAQGSGSAVKLGTFILLFNPWSKDDAVFMSDEAEKEEYVLQDAGAIFVGTANKISMIGWNYGQFEEEILEISLAVLDHSLNFLQDPIKDVASRNNPKYIARVMSAMLNGNDDNGVLSGNWTGKYQGGKDPRVWNGSVQILKRWKSNNFQSVKFGQCWVFAGVLNTVMRCLGIPSRVVTNFNSAHDTDGNLTVDVFYDPKGKPVERSRDSVWNFHVWNESWFVRTDLGPQYNGWQVLDATPQERSQGVFQCGPASVAAIREGEVNLNYDMPFVFAEVSADRVTRIYDAKDGSEKKTAVETNIIGVFISTKAVGSYNRLDITDNYKYPEGSGKERKVYEKARTKLKLKAAGMDPDAKKPSISGEFKVIGNQDVGKEVNLALVLKNLTNDMKTVTVNMTAWTIVYNGTLVHEVWKDSVTISLNSKEEVKHPVKITYAQYVNFLKADNVIRATAVCQVADEPKVVVAKDVILDNPPLTLKIQDKAQVKKPLTVQMIFANPLEEPVEDCVLTVEGSGLLRGILKVKVPALGPKEQSRARFEITPTRSGTKQLVADFSCNKFHSIKAMLNISVAQ